MLVNHISNMLGNHTIHILVNHIINMLVNHIINMLVNHIKSHTLHSFQMKLNDHIDCHANRTRSFCNTLHIFFSIILQYFSAK